MMTIGMRNACSANTDRNSKQPDQIVLPTIHSLPRKPMSNNIQVPEPPARQSLLADGKFDAERSEEARLAADFTRLYHQYRRAGYECYERLESPSVWHE